MKIHTVQKGDTLWKIAKQYNVNFQELVRINNQIKNPERITPGMKVKIPSGQVPLRSFGNPGHNKSASPKKEMPIPPARPKEMPLPPMEEEEEMEESPMMESPMPPAPTPAPTPQPMPMPPTPSMPTPQPMPIQPTPQPPMQPQMPIQQLPIRPMPIQPTPVQPIPQPPVRPQMPIRPMPQRPVQPQMPIVPPMQPRMTMPMMPCPPCPPCQPKMMPYMVPFCPPGPNAPIQQPKPMPYIQPRPQQPAYDCSPSSNYPSSSYHRQQQQMAFPSATYPSSSYQGTPCPSPMFPLTTGQSSSVYDVTQRESAYEITKESSCHESQDYTSDDSSGECQGGCSPRRMDRPMRHQSSMHSLLHQPYHHHGSSSSTHLHATPYMHSPMFHLHQPMPFMPGHDVSPCWDDGLEDSYLED